MIYQAHTRPTKLERRDSSRRFRGVSASLVDKLENFVALADKHEMAINDVLEGMCSQLNEIFSHGIAMHLTNV